jgi:hypothetical protein
VSFVAALGGGDDGGLHRSRQQHLLCRVVCKYYDVVCKYYDVVCKYYDVVCKYYDVMCKYYDEYNDTKCACTKQINTA